MKNNIVYLRSWRCYKKVCCFYPNTGEKQWVKDIEKYNIDGIFKPFLLGKWLAVFKQNNQWEIQYKKHRFPLNDPILEWSINRLSFFTKICIKRGSQRFTFFEATPLAALIAKVDPTYDHLDELGDNFSLWLQKTVLGAVRKKK